MSRTHLFFTQLALRASLSSAQDGDADGDGGSGGGDGPPAYFHKIVVAHAVLASLSWVIFFPLGAVLMRTMSSPNTIWVHAAIRGFTTIVFTAAVGMGIWMARVTHTHSLNTYHPIIGLVIFSAIWLQILMALVHHFVLFKKHQRRTTLAVAHMWLGRVLITVGMVNGGLGLKLSWNAGRGDCIAYGVVSGVIWLAYVCLISYFEIRAAREGPQHRGVLEKRRVLNASDRSENDRGSYESPGGHSATRV
ncbi:hypothetical protein LTR99_005074 [Exophiala xenobiotica]|uniref:Cytochrome b561 domain-containing protein n=1 Tax=Vermiconidia calcicola TaxID=1690605 RepID=A0AAV9QE83_9PEZI|nr:hypothetical protein LTR72_002934 [Exophiala xenobiotica]KAK5536459.1 hypothetical protein LTR23_007894 [Chaetothyriales sp. CCFEE 6169]KAK5541445.1 hypothetical protein LTR25_003223 [Vermiconidia calcicola]KAK5270631.1 hypothetical protein LTR96_003908 [Exophiala xenobiotica]KAK5300695.1 hypothetical protein LTR14_001092 [Exophiala xenobiotica]